MSDNTNKNFDVSSTVYFIFCILFAVTGIWFPAAFMWVVWAFVGYVALMVIVGSHCPYHGSCHGPQGK